jgi:hypothetical protein
MMTSPQPSNEADVPGWAASPIVLASPLATAEQRTVPVFRITDIERSIADVETVEQIGPAIQAVKPGLYLVYEIVRPYAGSTPFAQRWGVGNKLSDGSVVVTPDQRNV